MDEIYFQINFNLLIYLYLIQFDARSLENITKYLLKYIYSNLKYTLRNMRNYFETNYVKIKLQLLRKYYIYGIFLEIYSVIRLHIVTYTIYMQNALINFLMQFFGKN